MKPNFCTLFDKNYLLKGVVMLRTLILHCPGARIFVLCMDDETFELLGELRLAGVERLRLSEIEDDRLLRVKPTRSRAEYCWTLAPCLPWHIFETHSDVESITYLDADLMFFSSPEPIFDEIGGASIAIIEHRYTPRLAHLQVQGRFNVEWVGFRRDAEGIACLAQWREQCIDWCFARIEPNRMADQKYLDAWPSTYRSVHIVQHPGAGLAPWNFPSYTIATSQGGNLLVDGRPLIFYHFHQMEILRGGRFDRLGDVYTRDAPAPSMIYQRYEEALRQVLSDVRQLRPAFVDGIKPWLPVFARRAVQRLLPLRLKSALRRFVQA